MVACLCSMTVLLLYTAPKVNTIHNLALMVYAMHVTQLHVYILTIDDANYATSRLALHYLKDVSFIYFKHNRTLGSNLYRTSR